MSKSKIWTDELGHQIRVGDFIAYGVARANISFAVVYEVNATNLKIKYPEFKYDWSQNPRMPLGWKTRKSTLTTTDVVVIPIERINKMYIGYRQFVAEEDTGRWGAVEEQYRKIQQEILNSQIT